VRGQLHLPLLQVPNWAPNHELDRVIRRGGPREPAFGVSQHAPANSFEARLPRRHMYTSPANWHTFLVDHPAANERVPGYRNGLQNYVKVGCPPARHWQLPAELKSLCIS